MGNKNIEINYLYVCIKYIVIMDKNIDDDLILSLEYYHDNPEYKCFFEKETNFYDMINNKKINLNKINEEPEEVLKKKMFNNIKYKNISITDKKFKNTIELSNPDTNYLLIFDNLQLNGSNIKLLSEIFFNGRYNIFVPSIYIFEKLFSRSKIDKIINDIHKLDPNIIISNPIDINNNIVNDKKIMARNVGVYKNNTEFEILNFNNISKEKNKTNTNNIIKEIINTKKYIEYYNNDANRQFYEMFLSDAYNEIISVLVNGQMPNKITLEDFSQMTNVIKLILGTKEARDSYYIQEITEYINKNQHANYFPIYITKDEISNIRCVLNKISSINIYPSIPRYFCYIKNDKLIVKLFSIFFDFDGSGDYAKNKYAENFKLITKNSEALITKILTGGYINLNEISLSKTFDFIKYISIKNATMSDNAEEFNNFNSIDDVKKYLIHNHKFIYYFYNILIKNPNSLSNYVNAEPNFLNVLLELKKILVNLLLIESKYSYQILYQLNDIFEIKNAYTYQMRLLNENLNKYVYYSEQIPILTNCILASSYLNEIVGYSNLANCEKRNFIKNLLLKDFYDNHSVLMFQIIFNVWNVVYDYKNFNNDVIKLKPNGVIGDLADYDEQFGDEDI